MRSRAARLPARMLWPLGGLALLAMTGCAQAGATTQGGEIHGLYGLIMTLAAPVFVVVEVLLLWLIFQGRRRQKAGAGEPPQSHGTRRALIAFFLIPTVIVAVDYVFGERTLAEVQRQDPNPTVTIRVDGF